MMILRNSRPVRGIRASPGSSSPGKQRRLFLIVVTIVAVVVVIGSVFAVVIDERHNKVGTISDSQLSALVGMQLVSGHPGAPLPNSSWIVLEENSTFYTNHRVSSVYGGIWISSYEFPSSNYSKAFYAYIYAKLIYGLQPGQDGNLSNAYVSVYSGSYNGFQYTVEIAGNGSDYFLQAIGYSGQYLFFITDTAIPVKNVKGLILDEILSMTG